jgi:hypothetical protein
MSTNNKNRPWYRNPDIVSRIVIELAGGTAVIIAALITTHFIGWGLTIDITEPDINQEVSFHENVHADISRKITQEDYLWLVINPETNPDLWWPQARICSSTGHWEKKIYIGREEEDSGVKFNIAVIEVDANDSNNLVDYFISCTQTGNYTGIPLPNSANTIEYISVTRK